MHGIQQFFSQAVARQLVSDVPIGSYLSGGIDSSSITAVASKHLERLTTFTAGFDLTSVSGLELGYDERRSAEIMANAFKTEHYEVVLHAGDMERVLPHLIYSLEDLRIGQSYPNYYVARLASRFVKVVLSGIGGDELFAGYPWRYFRFAPSTTPQAYLREYYNFWQRLVPDHDKPRLFRHEILKEIGAESSFDVFCSVFEPWLGELKDVGATIQASLLFEAKTFLHGLLVVEDRLSMAHSLETRVPFLDDDLVAFAVRIPPGLKLRQLHALPRMDENSAGKRRLYERTTNEGKAILRKAMAKWVPQEILDRAKQGFSAPDAIWFRGESIDYINRLLRSPKARINEFLEPKYVAEALDQHCSGRENRRLLIWSLLSFEWWCRIFLDQAFPTPFAVRSGRRILRDSGA
jgi:asparagine synthase (glutamine-hydrolysing)